MIIRDARADDGDSAYRLIVELGYPTLTRAQFDAAFVRALDGNEVRILVVEMAGELRALATLDIRPQLRMGGLLVSIDEFVVDERTRGHGLGGTLLTHICQMAREMGALRVELHTRRTRESYRRGFYVKHGFVEADSAVMRWEP